MGGGNGCNNNIMDLHALILQRPRFVLEAMGVFCSFSPHFVLVYPFFIPSSYLGQWRGMLACILYKILKEFF